MKKKFKNNKKYKICKKLKILKINMYKKMIPKYLNQKKQ